MRQSPPAWCWLSAIPHILGCAGRTKQDALRRCLHRAGLPATLADAGVAATGASLVEHMLHDKKMSGGTLPFLLARGIGQTFLSKDVVLDDVAAFLDAERQS